ncbi:hypothetical protein GYA54_01770 [Candidatus Kuenenbacteria bacterium]|nr:hypothetical protein [Candidatus Kuenenbacteria bacterium]
MKKIVFWVIFGLVLLSLPIESSLAVYNAVQWSDSTRLSFPGVAKVAGEAKGISIDVYADTFLEYYYLDVASLRLQMRSGSKVYLESLDRKLFNVPTGYPDTECLDGYSRFSYEATAAGLTDFTITFTDGGNCPETAKTEEPATPKVEQIDVTNLDKIATDGLTKKLGQNSKTHFVYDNIIETVDILSVSMNEVKVGLSTPAKEFNLIINKEKIVDTDADGWNDLSLTLKSTDGGEAELVIKKKEPVKVVGINPGDLVKVADGTTVYYVGADSKLYIFPNEKVYYTWYQDFSTVKIISSSDLGRYGWGGLATYRPGAKMIKFSISPAVYVVDKGGVLHKLKDENMAREMYGDEWNKKIDDINEAFMFSYVFGDDLMTISEFNPVEASQLTPTVEVDKGI